MVDVVDQDAVVTRSSTASAVASRPRKAPPRRSELPILRWTPTKNYIRSVVATPAVGPDSESDELFILGLPSPVGSAISGDTENDAETE